MIKSPSAQSNNKSLYNIENYNKNFSNDIEQYTSSYLSIIKFFIQLISGSTEVKDFNYCEFLILRGMEC